MDKLAYYGMAADLELKKKLAQLIKLKKKAQEELDSNKLSPLEEMNTRSAMHNIDEIIGKIRFHSLDYLNVLGNDDKGTKTDPTASKDVKKSNFAPGVTSTETQQTSDTGNQNGCPIKVSPKEKGGEDVELNREGFFKGFDPEMDEDAFYKSIDNILGIEVDEKMELLDNTQKLPRGTKTLAKQTEFEIYHGLRNTVNKWFEGIEKGTDPYHALADLKMNLIQWSHESKSNSADTIQELYDRGMQAGLQKGAKAPHEKSMRHLVHKANSIGPALDNFRDSCYGNLSRIMKRHVHNGEHALYREKREIDSWLRKQRWQTRLMVKTEVAKTANLGLLESWGADTEKYMYNYFWNSIEDDRTKPISSLRKSGNPYTFDECDWLWKNQEQLMPDGKFMGDQYNQRCSISRQRIDKQYTGNRFIGREAEFHRTV
jgi:hypothetical protein